MSVSIIAKEEIHDLSFPHKDLNNIEKKALLDECEKAMKLGNSYKGKCKIYFEDSEGIKMVETTVWFADNEHVVLKGDNRIPLSNIVKIEL